MAKKVKAKKESKRVETKKPLSAPQVQQPEQKKVVVAISKDVLSSPQKLRLVADLVRGLSVEKAIDVLNFTQKKAAKIVLKTLKSAVANAENNQKLDVKSLFISRILVNDGIKLARYRVASRGRINRYTRRRAHILIELQES